MTIDERVRLPKQLVQPLLATVSLPFVDVASVRRARRLPVDQHAEAHRRSRRCGPHYEVKVAAMKTVHGRPRTCTMQSRRFQGFPELRAMIVDAGCSIG